ncbi:MAG: ABC transporter permease [Alphaproteobacteria bacterium]|nr:MAG: ABC transporter permease [Alphaproteobacteria bacterium]
MRALDRKLLRDLRRLWPQALAIALVLAAGVATLLMSFGMYRALYETREAYYERNRFAQVFATVTRAPLTLAPEIRAIPGVQLAEFRITGTAPMDLPGHDETATARLISLPLSGAPLLNVPLLREGRFPDPEARDEVVVNEPFARANGYRPGTVIHATLNGEKRALTITGTALSPEFIYTLPPGGLMPDNENFAILWLPRRVLAGAYDMQGAFNDVALTLSRGADEAAVIAALDRLLTPYGSLGAHGRALQQSHAFVDSEIHGLKVMSIMLPPVFFGIAAFLVGMVIARIVELERSEIGLMKAVGYTNREVAAHYLALAGLIALVGIGLGYGVGAWLSRALARLYAQYFDFPYVIFAVPVDAYAISGGLGLVSALLGALKSAWTAARLPPAVAMAPPAPPFYRKGAIDVVIAALRLSQPTRMILRGIIRWPLRAALTALGMALAVAVLVAAGFFTDSMDEMMENAFWLTNRQDAILVPTSPMTPAVIDEVGRLPGVLMAEGMTSAPVRLRHGHLEKRVSIETRPAGAELSRLIDRDGRPIVPAPGSLVLSERLAQVLELAPGMRAEVQFLTGRRETAMVPVSEVVPQYIGLGAYMAPETLRRLRREGPRVSAVSVKLDASRTAAFHAALKQLPRLSAPIMLDRARQSFRETLDQNITVMSTIYVVIAVVITVGVAYNAARIQLSERARDLASLRILGFTEAEVSYILMGETLLLSVLAQPLGWALGAGLAWATIKGMSSDLYSLPWALTAQSYARASVVVLAAALVSALAVRRRLARLDLVEVMKTRE